MSNLQQERYSGEKLWCFGPKHDKLPRNRGEKTKNCDVRQNMNMNMNMVASSLKTPAMIMSDQLHMDTSDSVPRLHTDSSCSEHEASPEFTCEREVQSEPKWNNELDNAFNYLEFNYMDGFSDDPFAPQPPQFQMDQLSPLQDMFTYLQN
jgi:hypothetical protein